VRDDKGGDKQDMCIYKDFEITYIDKPEGVYIVARGKKVCLQDGEFANRREAFNRIKNDIDKLMR